MLASFHYYVSIFTYPFDSWKIHNNSTLLCQDFGVFSWKAKVYSKLKMYITVEMPSRVMSGSSCWRAIIITICSLTKETVRRSVKLRLTRVKLLENYSTPIYTCIVSQTQKSFKKLFDLSLVLKPQSPHSFFSLRDVVHCSEIGFSILMKFSKKPELDLLFLKWASISHDLEILIKFRNDFQWNHEKILTFVIRILHFLISVIRIWKNRRLNVEDSLVFITKNLRLEHPSSKLW